MGAGSSRRYEGVVCIGAYNNRVKYLSRLLLDECENLVLIVPKKSPTDEFTPGTIVLEGCGSVKGSLRSCFDIVEALNIDVQLCVVLPPGLMDDCDISHIFYHAYVCTAFAVLSEYSKGGEIFFSQFGLELSLGRCGLLGLLKCVRAERPNLNVREVKGVGNLVGSWDNDSALFICRQLIMSGL